MNDTDEATNAIVRGFGKWLLLIHQLPPEPAYVRVKVRRQLQRIGAQALKNSVYVLPNRGDSLEDFHWLRRSILDDGGEATVVVADVVEGAKDQDLEDQFRRESRRAYAELVKAVRGIGDTEKELRRLRSQLEDLSSRDWFDAPGRAEAERALAQASAARSHPGSSASAGAAECPRGATWVTRRDVFVDRMASAWLILRFIDPAARFKFVEPEYKPSRGELRFDMFDGEYTHEGDRCTFETLLLRFGLVAPALHRIGRIVHDIDLKVDATDALETEAIRFLLRGICLSRPGDEERIEAVRPVFDGLLANFEREP
ncbi:MAG: chromate resistance protein ChrB domain-containing protein [Gemmatimonadaceae bacterium]